jgi:hypothetical protein
MGTPNDTPPKRLKRREQVRAVEGLPPVRRGD